jgi:hypothetical protein
VIQPDNLPASGSSGSNFDGKTYEVHEDSGTSTSSDYSGNTPISHANLISEANVDTQQRCTISLKNLCGYCDQLNLVKLLETVEEPGFAKKQYPVPWKKDVLGPILDFGGMSVIKVGERFRTFRQTHCVSCDLLVASRISIKEGSAEIETETQDEGDELRVVELLPSFASSLMPTEPDGCSRALYLVLVPGQLFNPKYNQIRIGSIEAVRKHARSTGCVVLLRATEKPPTFGPKAISPIFDACGTNVWLQYCIKNHKLFCHLEQAPMQGVRVIDCDTHFIQYRDASTPYVALSYVWGPGTAACNVTEVKEGHQGLPDALPLVIQDSIKITKALGFRYLWVDKLCIDQEDPSAKHQQIRQVDTIDQNAELTIVATAGQTES